MSTTISGGAHGYVDAESIPGLKAPGKGLVLWEVLYPAQVDPFSAAERASAAGLPADPPFTLP